MRQFNKKEKAKEFIVDCLKNGKIPVSLVLEYGVKLGVSERTLRRAAYDLVFSEKEGSVWYWILINKPKIECGFFDGLDDD